MTFQLSALYKGHDKGNDTASHPGRVTINDPSSDHQAQKNMGFIY